MALLNASGNPVATKTVAIQIAIEVPTEEAVSVGSINWFAAMIAVAQLATAWASGNTMAIAAALQALLKALTGG